MNATDALARLQRMTQYATEPALTSDDLSDLLMHAASEDEDGREPQEDAWEPTYSAIWLNAAAAEGWRWKAGKLGAGETFSSDGASFNPEQRRNFCLEMAQRYQMRVAGSIRTKGRTAQASSAIDYDKALVN